MNRRFSDDLRPEAAMMKASITSKLVAEYAYGTLAMARFVSQKRLVANDGAWEMAA